MRFPIFSREARLAKASRRNRSTRHIGRGIEQLEDRRLLATIPVSLSSDGASPVDDGEITLREAIAYVNGDFVPAGDRSAFDFANLGTNDRITFDPTVFNTINPKTIDLAFGELSVSRAVKIIGPGVDVLTVRQLTVSSRVFNVDLNGMDFALRSMTITGGNAVGNGGGVLLNSTNDGNSSNPSSEIRK